MDLSHDAGAHSFLITFFTPNPLKRSTTLTAFHAGLVHWVVCAELHMCM